MNLDAYLARIGLNDRPPATLEGLRTLHRAHLTAIPYENFDVQLGRPVAIELPAIYDKIVLRRRGGWCYEMNGMLGWALGELGFRVRRATGAVMREALGEVCTGNHLVLRVELPEGLYLADVGFGDGPLDPIQLEEGDFNSNGFTYGLSRIDGDWWRLRHHEHGGPKSFDFNLDAADEALLAAKCAELQTAPDSTFVLNLLCFRQRLGAVENFRGLVRRTVTPAGVVARAQAGADEMQATLNGVFALDLPEAAALWPKFIARHAEILAQQQVASA
ncbi:MAG TPA: arylamine N-acetyltransferase [Rhizomicrobium sp.]|jgi:N-hydroxyarylamine O-acetyltransferase|nr:arylamine N-acetyltransferase [Rhizomicrobium sp.]